MVGANLKAARVARLTGEAWGRRVRQLRGVLQPTHRDRAQLVQMLAAVMPADDAGDPSTDFVCVMLPVAARLHGEDSWATPAPAATAA